MKAIFTGIVFLFSLQVFSQDKDFYDKNFNKTFEYLSLNQYYQSTKLIDSIIDIATKGHNITEQARFMTLKANVYENTLDIEKAEQYNLKAMSLFKSVKNDYMYNWTYVILIANYMSNKNYEAFYKNLPIVKSKIKDDFLLFFIYEMELRALYNQKKHTELLNVVDGMIDELKNTSFKTEEYQKEIYRYKSIYSVLKAFSLIESSKFKESDNLLNEVMKIKFNDLFWLEEDDLKYEPLIYQYKIKILLNKKRYDSIQYYHQKYIKSSRNFVKFMKKNSKNTKKILNEILANERKTLAKNNKLKIEKQKDQNRLIISSSLIILGILLVFTIYRYRQSKILRVKSDEIALLNDSLQEKNKHLKNKNEQNKALITLNERSIFSKTVQISTLRDNLQKIINSIKSLTENKTTVSSVDLFRIENQLESVIDENDIWEEFKIQFEKIRPNFFNKLKEINSKITVNDLKHCAYIIINLKVKDVANLINVSPRSVETARYRLRKKLNIPTKMKLYDFLNEIV